MGQGAFVGRHSSPPVVSGQGIAGCRDFVASVTMHTQILLKEFYICLQSSQETSLQDWNLSLLADRCESMAAEKAGRG